MSATKKNDHAYVWVAQSHQMEDTTVEVFTSLGAAEHWAVDAIPAREWEQFAQSLAQRGETPSRIGIDSPVDVLADWYGPVSETRDANGDVEAVEYGVGGDVFLIIEKRAIRS